MKASGGYGGTWKFGILGGLGKNYWVLYPSVKWKVFEMVQTNDVINTKKICFKVSLL